MTTLGNELTQTLTELTDLILLAPDGEGRNQLIWEHRVLSNKLQNLIDGSIPTATDTYTAAIASLGEARETIREAQEDVGKIVDAVKKVADAANAVIKVIATLT